MLSKNQVKFIRSLHSKKGRESHRLFLAEGSKLVLEVLEGSYEVVQLFALQEWIDDNAATVCARKPAPEPVLLSEMERITALSTPSPALALVRMRDPADVLPVSTHALTLVLDDIQDPGNLGTIIRIADWFGIRRVVCSPGTADLYNPKVIQATMGSFTRVEIVYAELAGFLSSHGLPAKVYGTLLGGKNLYGEELSDSGLIVIGNESRGISAAVEKFVTDKITIPSYASEVQSEDHAESLNAAIATAIVCAEFRRRSHG
jgi:TrmH family RNA methyltransferase